MINFFEAASIIQREGEGKPLLIGKTLRGHGVYKGDTYAIITPSPNYVEVLDEYPDEEILIIEDDDNPRPVLCVSWEKIKLSWDSERSIYVPIFYNTDGPEFKAPKGKGDLEIIIGEEVLPFLKTSPEYRLARPVMEEFFNKAVY